MIRRTRATPRTARLAVRHPGACASASRRRGFTLIELLIALAIAALLMSIAVVRSGGATAPSAHAELERVRALVALGSEQAILRGEDLGIAFTATGYRFFERVHAAWQPLHAPRAYRAYTLAAGLSLRLRVEDAAVSLPEHAAAPQVLLWSSGELTPFELILAGNAEQLGLVAAADGALSLRAAVR